MMYSIVENADYTQLTHFFYENGLEIKPGIERPDNVVKCWSCTRLSDDKLIAAAALEIRSGEYVVADLAVDQDYRNEKIGTQLMQLLEEEIVMRGGKDAWLVGKVPDFYKKLGWEIVTREQSPDISKCFTCLKYRKECHPQVMHKTF